VDDTHQLLLQSLDVSLHLGCLVAKNSLLLVLLSDHTLQLIRRRLCLANERHLLFLLVPDGITIGIMIITTRIMT
jgi:hypothetical protein